MPSLKERHRNNIRTGIFVSVVIALALGVVVVLSGGLTGLTRTVKTYVASYSVADGISNLKSGAEVRVGGLSMGSVESITPDFNADSLDSILVTFELDGRITLREGAEIYVKGALIGSEAWLEIPNLGDPEAAVIESSVDGTSPVGLLASVLGPDSAARTHQILDDTADTMANTNSITSRIDTAVVEYDERILAILDDLGLTVADLKDLMASVETSWENEWVVQINQLMEWTGDFTEQLDTTVLEGQRFVTHMSDVVDDNKAQFAKIIDHADVTAEQIEELLRHLNQDTLQRADKLLARAQDGVDSASAVMEELNARKARWSEDLSSAMVNANLMSTQLRLVSEEVRRNPWKLLHRPTDDELEHELLYAAARSFAVATADLKAASESAKSLLEGYGDRIDADGELRARLERDVIDSVDRYQAAQEKLLAVIFEGSP